MKDEIMSNNIAFIDLAAQQARLKPKIDAAIATVLDHGGYIMGPEVGAFEDQLGAFAGLSQSIGCASGTDALALPLMAWGLRPGDAVLCPAFTFASTAEVVAWLGAVPVFVDIEADTFNIDPAGLRRAIEQVKREGELTPRVVIAVDLFGQAANYAEIRAICDEHDLKLISDAAQGFGATIDGEQSGKWADCVATSFFPAKPLGCYGDGGAVLTDDEELADIIRSLRVHGKGTDKYDNVRVGMNGRLDTLQAAILIEKLAVFGEEIVSRNRLADRYREGLADVVVTPFVPDGYVSTWAQYTLTLSAGARDGMQTSLKDKGVPTAVYYPKPLHRQTAYKRFPVEGNGLPVSDDLAHRVMSLPMHPYMDDATVDRIIAAVREAAAGL
ncbi:DegT/DnrJ/EryC1/StrS aminotransferase family protein [Rhizobiaceae bacterium]|nr:DegT/DnrJ/EryC1/StrS aminotransferase family protein [Rhizobiaceae bacterium]